MALVCFGWTFTSFEFYGSGESFFWKRVKKDGGKRGRGRKEGRIKREE